ncbi:4'-phosphopantetheinyl transferase superfamily protein [Flavobacterium sp. IMCC34518]|uniref:4'-phosphopantetheinyl transferase family protein n=1 Tax=Flavobacterium sp. IMCC34518 TaxID=3003623 RepID=UPI0022AC8E8C|nr:4'-phosphopantetheinyl transferase superfamily protein [Flavobacterium sp. IMCC34518]
MIGNDIVDLFLVRKESNWRRKGYLEKIFTQEEQNLIHNDSNPEQMVWNLWTRKESSYKIYNRETGISGYFPLRLKCHFEDEFSGIVSIGDFVFYTQTQITDSYIYSIAVSRLELLDNIITLENFENIKKENGIPFIFDLPSNSIKPVSISHHGRFQRIITLR